MIAVGVELLGVRVILSSTQSTHRHQEKPERIMCEREPITHTHTRSNSKHCNFRSPINIALSQIIKSS